MRDCINDIWNGLYNGKIDCQVFTKKTEVSHM